MTTYITKMLKRLGRTSYDRYGSPKRPIAGWVMDQNPGIEMYAIVLPLGITINLPDAPRKLTPPPVLKQIFLWK